MKWEYVTKWSHEMPCEDVDDSTVKHLKNYIQDVLIDHPPYYNYGKLEAISVIEDWKLPYHLGCVIKYVCRAGYKPDHTMVQDLKKARFYITRYIELLEKPQ